MVQLLQSVPRSIRRCARAAERRSSLSDADQHARRSVADDDHRDVRNLSFTVRAARGGASCAAASRRGRRSGTLPPRAADVAAGDPGARADGDAACRSSRGGCRRRCSRRSGASRRSSARASPSAVAQALRSRGDGDAPKLGRGGASWRAGSPMRRQEVLGDARESRALETSKDRGADRRAREHRRRGGEERWTPTARRVEESQATRGGRPEARDRAGVVADPPRAHAARPTPPAASRARADRQGGRFATLARSRGLDRERPTSTPTARTAGLPRAQRDDERVPRACRLGPRFVPGRRRSPRLGAAADDGARRARCATAAGRPTSRPPWSEGRRPNCSPLRRAAAPLADRSRAIGQPEVSRTELAAKDRPALEELAFLVHSRTKPAPADEVLRAVAPFDSRGAAGGARAGIRCT